MCLEHGPGGHAFGGDQIEGPALAGKFALDGRGQFRVELRQAGLERVLVIGWHRQGQN